MKNTKKIATLSTLIIQVVLLILISGCASKQSKTVITSESYQSSQSQDGTNYQYRPETETETEIVRTEQTVNKESESKGLFGILGDIIAWPFRIIGSIF